MDKMIVDDLQEPNNSEVIEKIWQSLSAEQRKEYASREILIGGYTLPADFMENFANAKENSNENRR